VSDKIEDDSEGEFLERDALKFVKLNRNSSLKATAGKPPKRKIEERKGKDHSGSSDEEIFPPVGVPLKRWNWRASYFDPSKQKWVTIIIMTTTIITS